MQFCISFSLRGYKIGYIHIVNPEVLSGLFICVRPLSILTRSIANHKAVFKKDWFGNLVLSTSISPMFIFADVTLR